MQVNLFTTIYIPCLYGSSWSSCKSVIKEKNLFLVHSKCFDQGVTLSLPYRGTPQGSSRQSPATLLCTRSPRMRGRCTPWFASWSRQSKRLSRSSSWTTRSTLRPLRTVKATNSQTKEVHKKGMLVICYIMGYIVLPVKYVCMYISNILLFFRCNSEQEIRNPFP